MPRARSVLAPLALAGLLGCAHQQQVTPAPPRAPAEVPTPGTPPPAAAASSPAAPASKAAPAPGAPTPPAPSPNPPPRASTSTAAHEAAPKRPTAAATPTATAAAAPAPAQGSTAPRAPPTLDLASLEERLRDTHAIGVFTKLSLKNQVDDLLTQFRAYYAGGGSLTLEELRRGYELLLMKVVTLLQNGDPALANAVSSSREAIWAILSDRNRFHTL